MIYNQSGFKFKDGKLYYPNTIARPDSYLIFQNSRKVYQISVFNDGIKYYLSVVYEAPEKPYVDNGLYQAIDLGITKTISAINTQGKFYEAPIQDRNRYWNPL